MKLFTLMFFAVLSASAFSQTCYVDMVDRYNRVVRTYTGWGDQRTCIEGMKECRKAIRLEPYLGGVDCIRASDRYPSPRPQPQPNPYPNPYPPQRNLSYYLSLSDSQLAQEAQYGIGYCQVTQGNYSSACQYYMKIGNYGFGGGTGCAKREYTYSYGCNSYSELENAGCLTRIALQQRQCGI